MKVLVALRVLMKVMVSVTSDMCRCVAPISERSHSDPCNINNGEVELILPFSIQVIKTGCNSTYDKFNLCTNQTKPLAASQNKHTHTHVQINDN